LNKDADDVIRSLLVNEHDSSIVTLSFNAAQQPLVLQCTSTPATPR
jgi:hypothetical protein